MIKFHSIKQYSDIVDKIRSKYDFASKSANETIPLPKLNFIGRPKLHGANSSIVCDSDFNLTYQSRLKELSINDDSYGFCNHMSKFEEELKNKFKEIAPKIFNLFLTENKEDIKVIVYGEWVGKSLKNDTAICNIPNTLIVFDICVYNVSKEKMYYLPGFIDEFTLLPVRILPITLFKQYEINIDFNKPQEYEELLSNLTLKVEEECPVARWFGHHGIGEGIVWNYYNPLDPSNVLRFKIKGKRHAIRVQRQLTSAEIEVIKSTQEFVKYCVTEERLLQGLEYLKQSNLELKKENLGTFLKWLINDIKSEEATTISSNGLDEKLINVEVSRNGKDWYLDKLKNDAN